MIVDDALEAEGCSLDLKMPSEEWAGRSWRDWLEHFLGNHRRRSAPVV